MFLLFSRGGDNTVCPQSPPADPRSRPAPWLLAAFWRGWSTSTCGTSCTATRAHVGCVVVRRYDVTPSFFSWAYRLVLPLLCDNIVEVTKLYRFFLCNPPKCKCRSMNSSPNIKPPQGFLKISTKVKRPPRALARTVGFRCQISVRKLTKSFQNIFCCNFPKSIQFRQFDVFSWYIGTKCRITFLIFSMFFSNFLFFPPKYEAPPSEL